MRRLARLRLMATVSAVAAIISLAPASPALAAPGCREDGCNGKSAADQGCAADPINLASTTIDPNPNLRELHLLYSIECKAVWAELWAPGGGSDSRDTVEVEVLPEYGVGASQDHGTISLNPADHDFMTTMMGWREGSLRACASKNGYAYCTRWR